MLEPINNINRLYKKLVATDFFCDNITYIKEIITFLNHYNKLQNHNDVSILSKLHYRKFNFDDMSQCIDSDNILFERMQMLEVTTHNYDPYINNITNNSHIFNETDINMKNMNNDTHNEYNMIKKIIILLEKQKFHYNNSVITPIICHFINILTKSVKYSKYILKDEYLLKKYLTCDNASNVLYNSYAEEYNKNMRTNHTDDYIFTSKDIKNLNYLRYESRSIYHKTHARTIDNNRRNIFIPLCPTNERISVIHTLPYLLNQNMRWKENYKINDLETFKTKFKIFTHNIFENFNWFSDDIFVSGSAITACLAHNHLCGHDMNTYRKFLDKHYKKSDIDIFTNPEQLQKLAIQVYNIYKHRLQYKKKRYKMKKYLKDCIVKIYAHIEPSNNNKDPVCQCCKCVTPQDDYSTYEKHYSFCQNLENILYSSFKRQNIKIYKVSIDINTLFFKLRSIDIYSNNFGKISRYHMPIVRAAYNGKEIYMYPSFVCAALSGYCCDYRWFSGKKNPLSIIIDKWLKGYNILLNGKEQLQLITYFLNKYKKIAMNDIPIFHHYKTRWNLLDVDNVLKRIIKNCKVDANSTEYLHTTDRTRKELEQYLLGKIPIDLKNKKNYGRYDAISDSYMW